MWRVPGRQWLVEARKYWRSLFFLVLAAGLVSWISGCSGTGSGKDVMAKVNGYKVLRSEVDKTYNQQVAGSPQKPTPTEEEALRLNILNQIIYRQLLLQKAEKLGVLATDDEVESKFNQAKAPYTKEQFEKQLKDSGLSEDDFKLEVRRNLTVEKLLNKEIASKVNISDGDIKNYYDQNKSEFNLIEPRYRLATIFVSNQPTGEPGRPTDKTQLDLQAKRKIQMVLNRLNSGEDFGDLAQRHSDDQDTARSGGGIPPVPESQIKNLDPITRDAVQKLKPGQYTEVLPAINPQTRQPGGYQIIKLTGKDIAGQRDVNDPQVQQFIRNKLRSQREQILRAAYDESLRDNAEIHNYYAEQILNNSAGK
ncbi:MAG TPA: SurA N-terminal domain-containing protein [Candidatus Angelobacter sp.]|nr:SurA N-terminal domain-containing protein [Candidatus Angelobacter sp.]